VDEKAEREAAERAQRTAEDWQPLFTPEQLATPPSCPPLVGGFGTETPEQQQAREAAGLPPPPDINQAAARMGSPIMTTRDMRQGQVRTQDTDQRQAREREDRERHEREYRERQEREDRERQERQERERQERQERESQAAAERQHAAQESAPKRPAR
jgi:hypothetical protein